MGELLLLAEVWERACQHALKCPCVLLCSCSSALEIPNVVQDPKGKEFISKENKD